ncbi:MAG TPA: hydrogenase maturation protease [Streptosporangiaceae bacterium]|nr:hydrogenase maturation protease [Streptosporangiaceae bacterium]
MTGQTLVAGIGNIFLGDDGFGVEVATRLYGADLPGGVKVVDYGIRGMHLAYDLSSGYDAAILVDATARGGEPGTVYIIEPELGPAGPAATAEPGAAAGPAAAEPGAAAEPAGAAESGSSPAPQPGGQDQEPDPAAAALAGSPLLDAHGMQPDVVFSMLDMLGGERPGRVLIVGCEPASIEYGMGLSDPVAAAVDEAVRVVLDLVTATGEDCSDSGREVMAAGAQDASGQHLLLKGWAHVPRHPG